VNGVANGLRKVAMTEVTMLTLRAYIAGVAELEELPQTGCG